MILIFFFAFRWSAEVQKRTEIYCEQKTCWGILTKNLLSSHRCIGCYCNDSYNSFNIFAAESKVRNCFFFSFRKSSQREFCVEFGFSYADTKFCPKLTIPRLGYLGIHNEDALSNVSVWYNITILFFAVIKFSLFQPTQHSLRSSTHKSTLTKQQYRDMFSSLS